jgi:hypothetical protein
MDASTSRTVLDYHQRTKHHLDRYAAGPGTLDWDAQPDPFRHWAGAQTLALPRGLPNLDTAWSALPDTRPAAPLDAASTSTLLRLCVGITAWKEYGGARWALRANPSSGNLAPHRNLCHCRRRAGDCRRPASLPKPLPRAGAARLA